MSAYALVYYVQARLEPTLAEPIQVAAVTLDIRLGWKWLIVTNTLAYCNTELTTVVKSFIIQAYSVFP